MFVGFADSIEWFRFSGHKQFNATGCCRVSTLEGGCDEEGGVGVRPWKQDIVTPPPRTHARGQCECETGTVNRCVQTCSVTPLKTTQQIVSTTVKAATSKRVW